MTARPLIARRTVVDPDRKRRFAADGIAGLAERAQETQNRHNHSHDGPATALRICAEALRTDLGCLDVDRQILSFELEEREEKAAESEYHREVVPLLREALGLLRGLR